MRYVYRRVLACFYGGFIILLFIVLEAVTFMVLYQNHGNTFGNFINVSASNILNFKIKKIKNPNGYPPYKPAGTRHKNMRLPAVKTYEYLPHKLTGTRH